MTQFMSCLSDCVKAMDMGMGLEGICKGIRTQMVLSKCRTNGRPLEIGIRTINLSNSGDFIGDMSSKISTINEDFGNLSQQFQQTLSEEDEMEFIKKCADFHFDFTKVHPFTDANGRTSRVLMSMMLATRNYMLPSLYSTVYDKDMFYKRSNTAIKGDYSTIEQDVFERLGHFYPLVMPKIEKVQPDQSIPLKPNSVGIDDLEINSNGVGAQERIEGIVGMKKLAEKVRAKDKESLTEQREK